MFYVPFRYATGVLIIIEDAFIVPPSPLGEAEPETTEETVSGDILATPPKPAAISLTGGILGT